MVDLGETVFDAVFPAADVEHVPEVSGGRPVGITRRVIAVVAKGR
jgi:hypothetical protein